jgi:predicted nucleic acid-binding protein
MIISTERNPGVAEVFLDASYAIALTSPRDQHHADALRLADRLESSRTPMVTTRAVLLEVGNAFARIDRRSVGAALLDSLERDPDVEIVPLSEELYQQGAELYQRYSDKEWGLTDCISFVVMRSRGLRDALTSDDHFRQAGFRALLHEQ